MRSCALIALASLGVLGLITPCAAQDKGAQAPAVSVVKKSAPPQLLAPAQDDAPAPTPQAIPQPAEVPVVVIPHSPSPRNIYVPMPEAAPVPVEDVQAEGQGGFSSPERLMDWITNYREHRQPWRLPIAVHAMREYGLLADEEKAWFCTGFIAGVLGSNPKDGPGLIAKMFPMPDKEQAVIIRAIVYSGRPDWRDLLEKYSAKMPLRRPLIDDFLDGKRPTLMKLPLEHGGSPGIYALWGYYVATGQHQPVVRIIQALQWSRTKGDSSFSFRKVFSGWSTDPSAVDKITTGGTAKWTLASYAERDRELLALYRAEYERQPETISKPLKDVIEAAQDFESERIRKDQYGAIEDAQRQQMSAEAGMSKGATAGSIAIATGCVAATALGQAYIAVPCVIGGALYTGAVKLAH
jgi:hypothetical protein